MSDTKSLFRTIGASAHSIQDREPNDYYATDPVAVRKLLAVERFPFGDQIDVWEPACGEGHISTILVEHGLYTLSTDIVYRGFGTPTEMDFLNDEPHRELPFNVITNPPYKHAQEFVLRALEVVAAGYKVAMLMRIQFLESKKRRPLFEKHPPKTIYVFSERVMCAKNGDFEGLKASGGSAVCYAWFIWQKGYMGDTTIKWI